MTAVSPIWEAYQKRLKDAINQLDVFSVQQLADALKDVWINHRQVFICGNGGSAGNAIHLANDFLYGISKKFGNALRVHALPANSAVLTCLANDTGYQNIFSGQLSVLGKSKDLLLVFSGSGNSQNVIEAVQEAKKMGLTTSAILGYDGGKLLNMVDIPIHVPVNDMQISEDIQLVVGHMLMQYLYAHRDEVLYESS